MTSSLNSVDWSEIPAPSDDGAADHLVGISLPTTALPSTQGRPLSLANLSGTTVLFVYPMTGHPDRALPQGWDMIPGARGCTPQSCAFRDLYAELRKAGATRVFGLSTQTAEDQAEAHARLHLPFPLLSDAGLAFGTALSLPTFVADGKTLHKRITLISRADRIMTTFYPVFPPDQDAENVLNWLKSNSV